MKIIDIILILKNFIFDPLKNFNDHINKSNENSNPGRSPNSLITIPDKKAPVSPYKFLGLFSEKTPQPESSGWNENKIKKIDIELTHKIENTNLFVILMYLLFSKYDISSYLTIFCYISSYVIDLSIEIY